MPMRKTDLEIGQLFESEFERQARARGYHVVRHCDQLGRTGTKAPVTTGPFCGYRLPDFTLMRDGVSFWVEAKYKSRCPEYRKLAEPQHGIDLPNWRDYLAVCKISGLPGHMVFGEGHTGRIITKSFEYLRRAIGDSILHGREYHGSVHFEHGAVFWPAAIFSPWGTFDPLTGQMQFNFSEAEAR